MDCQDLTLWLADKSAECAILRQDADDAEEAASDCEQELFEGWQTWFMYCEGA